MHDDTIDITIHGKTTHDYDTLECNTRSYSIIPDTIIYYLIIQYTIIP